MVYLHTLCKVSSFTQLEGNPALETAAYTLVKSSCLVLNPYCQPFQIVPSGQTTSAPQGRDGVQVSLYMCIFGVFISISFLLLDVMYPKDTNIARGKMQKVCENVKLGRTAPLSFASQQGYIYRMQLGNLKSEIREIETDNPFFSPSHAESKTNRRKAIAFLNLEGNIAAKWFYRNPPLIDQAQLIAASDFQRWWEASGGRGAGAIDYSKPFVDGGLNPDPISLHRMIAAERLKEVHKVLGNHGFAIVQSLCAECQNAKDLWPSKRERDKATSLCRSMLDTLAIHLGYKGHKP